MRNINPKNISRTVEDYQDPGPRRSGRTTRLADTCVQEFFKNGFTVCRDHYPGYRMNDYLWNIVMKRLTLEHPRIELHARKNPNYVIAESAEMMHHAIRVSEGRNDGYHAPDRIQR
jgi:hypothetical protein